MYNNQFALECNYFSIFFAEIINRNLAKNSTNSNHESGPSDAEEKIPVLMFLFIFKQNENFLNITAVVKFLTH